MADTRDEGMDAALPLQKLEEIIRKDGVAICSDKQRCAAMLRDLCPSHKREVNLLVNALQENVPTKILASSNGVPQTVLLAQLATQLHNNHGIAEEYARWAVEGWARALGAAAKPVTQKTPIASQPAQKPVVQPPVPTPSTPKPVKQSARYTDNGDGTVTDKQTGLMWQKDTPKNTMQWHTAIFYAKHLKFAGYSDWRLPMKAELESLLNKVGSSIFDNDFFPDTVTDLPYWSSTSDAANDSSGAWGVNFLHGRVSGYYKSYGYRVRCVRSVNSSAPQPVVQAPIPTPSTPKPVKQSARYADNGDGTVTDKQTGLMWQKETPKNTMKWQDAMSFSSNLKLAGYSDWRLPDKEELESLLEGGGSPTIDKDFFPDTEWYYWSSTTYAGYTLFAWYVSFNNGCGNPYNKTDHNHIRCVRGGR